MRKIITSLMIVILAFVLASCGCKHEWQDATCETPKTCTLCQETEGEPLGHSWQEATCDAPRTCSGCTLTEGEALGHEWVDATCETPKTCTRCALTEGDAMGHNWNAVGCMEKLICLRCGSYPGDYGPHRDIVAIIPGKDEQHTILCRCGHSEQIATEDLAMRLLHGTWRLAAVVIDNQAYQPKPERNYKEGFWMEFPSGEDAYGYRAGTSELAAMIVTPMDLVDFKLGSVTTSFASESKNAIIYYGHFNGNDDDDAVSLQFLTLGSRNYGSKDWVKMDFSEYAEAVKPLLEGAVLSLWCQDPIDGYYYIYSYDPGAQ